MGTTPFITVRARRPLTEIEFCAWVAQAVPGEHREDVENEKAAMVLEPFARLPDQQRAELARLGSRAFWAAEQGLVHLVQERTGPDQFAYIAVARPKPKAAAVSLSALLLAEREAA